MIVTWFLSCIARNALDFAQVPFSAGQRWSRLGRVRASYWLVGVMGAFFCLCLMFAWDTPYRQAGHLLYQRGPDGQHAKISDIGAPDERQHANYVAHIREGKGLPVLKPGSTDLYETYQAHQPPLYYLLAAGWSSLLGADPTSPDQGTGLKLRSLNALIGLSTLLGVYVGARVLLQNDNTAMAATAVCLLPMNLALHGALSNDPLLIALCTWSVTGLILGIRTGFSLKIVLIVGLSTGLALLTKTTALALFPVIALGLLAGRNRDWRVWVGCLALPVALAMPLWLRNLGLYGDPFALKAFNEAFVGSPQASAFIEGFGPWAYWANFVLWWTARSLIGVFGYMDIFMLEQVSRTTSGVFYNLAACLLILILVIGLVQFRNMSREDSRLKVAMVPVLALPVIVALLFVRFNLQYFQGQGRYLYPALAPVAWLLAAGVASPQDKSPAGLVRAIVWSLVLLSVSLLAWSELGPAFAIRLSGITQPSS